jgi:hypothetical protein
MNSNANKFTHVGWFSFCPVYIAEPYGGNPILRSRYVWLKPVLRLAVAMQRVAIMVCMCTNPHWQPTWRLKVSGEVK